MTISVVEAKHILRSRKRLLIGEPLWQLKASRIGSGDQLEFKSRVTISGAVPRGVWFRCIVFSKHANVGSIQLDCDHNEKRSHTPLYRLDWHPLRPHINGSFGLVSLRKDFIGAGVTHEHCCLYNICYQTRRIRSNGVQTARKIVPDFATFNDALAHVCAKLRIANWREIPPQTEIQQELF